MEVEWGSEGHEEAGLPVVPPRGGPGSDAALGAWGLLVSEQGRAALVAAALAPRAEETRRINYFLKEALWP